MSVDITPNDIQGKQFLRAFRGLKAEDVYDHLKIVAVTFEDILRQNKALSERIRQLEETVEEYRQMEATLKNTLISSQKIGEELKEEAERKSSLLLQEADLEAKRIIDKARGRKESLEEETFQLVNQHKRFTIEFLALIETHRKMIQAQEPRLLLERDFKGMPPSLPNVALENSLEDEETPEKSLVGEEEISDLEIITPEGKE